MLIFILYTCESSTILSRQTGAALMVAIRHSLGGGGFQCCAGNLSYIIIGVCLIILTIQMFFLWPHHFFCGGFTHNLGQPLTGEAVLGRCHAVHYTLSRHFKDKLLSTDNGNYAIGSNLTLLLSFHSPNSVKRGGYADQQFQDGCSE